MTLIFQLKSHDVNQGLRKSRLLTLQGGELTQFMHTHSCLPSKSTPLMNTLTPTHFPTFLIHLCRRMEDMISQDPPFLGPLKGQCL